MRNIDFINKKIAKKRKIDESIVKTINKYYWDTVRKRMLELDSTAVWVRGLLTFCVSRYNLKKEIQETINKIRNIQKSERIKNKKPLVDGYIILLKRLLKSRNKMAIHYNERYKNRTSAAIYRVTAESLKEPS